MKLISQDECQSEFVENLYKNLRKETELILSQKHIFMEKAASYLSDGLSDVESVELMIIETGLPREACEGYVEMAENNSLLNEGNEYSFQFEDSYGKIWSSIDIGRKIFAQDDESAWAVAEELLDTELRAVEAERIISIKRIS